MQQSLRLLLLRQRGLLRVGRLLPTTTSTPPIHHVLLQGMLLQTSVDAAGLATEGARLHSVPNGTDGIWPGPPTPTVTQDVTCHGSLPTEAFFLGFFFVSFFFQKYL